MESWYVDEAIYAVADVLIAKRTGAVNVKFDRRSKGSVEDRVTGKTIISGHHKGAGSGCRNGIWRPECGGGRHELTPTPGASQWTARVISPSVADSRSDDEYGDEPQAAE